MRHQKTTLSNILLGTPVVKGCCALFKKLLCAFWKASNPFLNSQF